MWIARWAGDSRFVVGLPLEIASASETYDVELAQEHPLILEPGQPEWRVLIVEDDPESAGSCGRCSVVPDFR